MAFDAILWITRTGINFYKPHLPIIQYCYASWQKKGILTKALSAKYTESASFFQLPIYLYKWLTICLFYGAVHPFGIKAKLEIS